MLTLVVVCVVAAAFGFFGSVPLAGPIAVMVVARAARKRFGEARRIAIGAALAEGLYAGAAFFGYTFLLGRRAEVVPISRGATALVLLVLGGYFLSWRHRDGKDTRENKVGTAILGFTVSAVNPTLLLTWSAAVALLYSKGLRAPAADAAPFGVCAAGGVAGWFSALVAIMRKYEHRLPDEALTWIVRAMGLMLVGLAAWSAVDFVQALRER
jgi:threonine/homoserine/homoserine lactone efflux protein